MLLDQVRAPGTIPVLVLENAIAVEDGRWNIDAAATGRVTASHRNVHGYLREPACSLNRSLGAMRYDTSARDGRHAVAWRDELGRDELGSRLHPASQMFASLP